MTVAIVSFKGGVGKTTTALHLAAGLARKAPTLLIDGDPNAPLLQWRERNTGRPWPFTVLSPPPAATGWEKFCAPYQYVVIDTEARPTIADLRLLAIRSSRLILPTTPDMLSMQATLQSIQRLRALIVSTYSVLLTMVPPGGVGDEARLWFRGQNIPVLERGIRRRAAFVHAATRGILISRMPGGRAADGWSDYRAVVQEILRSPI